MTLDDRVSVSTPYFNQVTQELRNLNFDANECCSPVNPNDPTIEKKDKEVVKKGKEKDKYQNVFFDFETYPDENNIHRPYLCHAYSIDDKNPINQTFC